MLDIDAAKYPLSVAARASGFEVATLRSYYQRGHFWLIDDLDQRPEAKGLPRFLSLRSVLGLAIAQRLWQRGCDPREAFNAGVQFAHTGQPNGFPHPREPGQLFDPQLGLTALVSKAPGEVEFVLIERGVEALQWPAFAGRSASLILLLNFVVQDVFAALDLDCSGFA